MEAETMCSDMCKRGLVDAVMSRDSDVLAYGAPIFLSDLDVRTQTTKQVLYEDVLRETGLTDEQFLDFCIMCSCDYNDRIKNIGPVKAFNMIKTHEKIENIPNVDPIPLKYELCREKFRNYEKTDYTPPYCGEPDFNGLAKFFFQYHIKTDMERLKKSFAPAELVFEDDE
jgi:flap endonuclease-1